MNSPSAAAGGGDRSNPHTLGLRLLPRIILVFSHFVRAVVESVAGDTEAER